MRISDLSRRSEVPITTIKYYLRTGLLPAGEPTAHNQALYAEEHLRRLRLIRALVSVRGMSVSATRDVLEAIFEPGGSLHRTLGLVLGALQTDEQRARQDEPEIPGAYREQTESLLEELGWRLHPRSEQPGELARSLQRMAEIGLPVEAGSLTPYARLAERTAALDLDQLEDAGDDPLDIAERAILVTAMMEPVLLLLRRMAQEHTSASRFYPPRDAGDEESERAFSSS